MTWKIFGWLALGVGVIGAFLPLLPTVPFLLLAAFCFERGSPEIHHWLVSHPKFGPPLVDWQKHRVIRWPAKLLAVGCILASLAFAIVYGDMPNWTKLVMSSVCAFIIVFLLAQKSRTAD